MKAVALCVFLFGFAQLHQSQIIKFMKVKVGNGRIIDGNPAKAGQFPWQACLHIDSGKGIFICGGALINRMWVLTAAHYLYPEVALITVKLGGLLSNLDSEEDKSLAITTSQFYLHHGYNDDTLNNDIALINLTINVQEKDTILPIPIIGANLKDNTEVLVSGWGLTSDFGEVSSSLQFVNLKTVDLRSCRTVYGRLPSNILCCKGDNTKSTCYGDSGGPLVVKTKVGRTEKWFHAGIVSFGHSSGCKNDMPEGFTLTSAYNGWINNIINR